MDPEGLTETAQAAVSHADITGAETLIDMLLNHVLTEAGLVAAVFAVLWWLERAERRAMVLQFAAQVEKVATVIEQLRSSLRP